MIQMAYDGKSMAYIMSEIYNLVKLCNKYPSKHMIRMQTKKYDK